MKFISELNWFHYHGSPHRHLLYQRYTTRICILSILISLIIISVFTAQSQTTFRGMKINPNQFEYVELYQNYSSTIFCPCRSISIPISTCVTVQLNHHPICSSDIFSLPWMKYSSVKANLSQDFPPWDFRRIAPVYFRLLQMFCSATFLNTNTSISSLLRTELIHSLLLPVTFFRSELQVLISSWQRYFIPQYSNLIELIENIFHQDQLISAGYCLCNESSSSCLTNVAWYDNDPLSGYSIELFRIPHWYYDCLPSNGLLTSTMECFMNESCLMTMNFFISQSFGEEWQFSLLNESMIFGPETTIASMVEKSMIEEYQYNISYSSYFDACQPEYCAYEYPISISIFTIVTTILSVFGGLVFVWEMFFLLIIRLIERCLTNKCNPMDLIRNIFNFADQERLTRQLHFIIVFIAIILLSTFSAFTPKAKSIEIKNVSIKIYEDLIRLFPDTLDCPCSDASMTYNNFLMITPQFHPICSITDLNQMNVFTSSIVQLQSLCQWLMTSVQEALDQFYARRLINTKLLPRDIFLSRIVTIIKDFRWVLSQSLLNTLSIIRELISANQLLSSVSMFDPDCDRSFNSSLTSCYPLETLLRTLLIDSYNQTLNITIETILNDLMIDHWTDSISYSNYFVTCSPWTCTYSYIDTSHVLEGITLFISLYGGVMVIGRWIAIILVRLYHYYRFRRVTIPTIN